MFTSASMNFCYIIIHRSCCNAAQINLSYPLLEVKCIRLCERLNWPLPSSLAVFAGASSALDFSGSTASLTLREIKGLYEKGCMKSTCNLLLLRASTLSSLLLLPEILASLTSAASRRIRQLHPVCFVCL